MIVRHTLNAIELFGDVSAAFLEASESTFPLGITCPFVVSTSICRPLTRESANSAILLFAVSHEPLMGGSSAVPSAFADPVMSTPLITRAVISSLS
jgi:hypothetical protein